MHSLGVDAAPKPPTLFGTVLVTFSSNYIIFPCHPRLRDEVYAEHI